MYSLTQNFWTQFKTAHLQGQLSSRQPISRPRCTFIKRHNFVLKEKVFKSIKGHLVSVTNFNSSFFASQKWRVGNLRQTAIWGLFFVCFILIWLSGDIWCKCFTLFDVTCWKSFLLHKTIPFHWALKMGKNWFNGRISQQTCFVF